MGRPEPTQEELDSWELPAIQASQRSTLNRQANDNYLDLFIQEGAFRELERDSQMVREIQEAGRLAGGPGGTRACCLARTRAAYRPGRR